MGSVQANLGHLEGASGIIGLTTGANGELTPSTRLTDLGLESLPRTHMHTQILTRLPDLAGLDRRAVQQAETVQDLARTAHHLFSFQGSQSVHPG